MSNTDRTALKVLLEAISEPYSGLFPAVVSGAAQRALLVIGDLEDKLRGPEYALLQAEAVIEQAIAFGGERSFYVLRSYGVTQ